MKATKKATLLFIVLLVATIIIYTFIEAIYMHFTTEFFFCELLPPEQPDAICLTWQTGLRNTVIQARPISLALMTSAIGTLYVYQKKFI